jgi:hypothetical protein
LENLKKMLNNNGVLLEKEPTMVENGDFFERNPTMAKKGKAR